MVIFLEKNSPFLYNGDFVLYRDLAILLSFDASIFGVNNLLKANASQSIQQRILSEMWLINPYFNLDFAKVPPEIHHELELKMIAL